METNGADKLISSILQEAHEQANAIEWHSTEAINSIRAKLEADREAVRDEFTKKAEAARLLTLSTARTNAELTARRDLLAGKRTLIDEAYSAAAKRVAALSGADRDSVLLKLLKRECEGGETVRPSEKDAEAVARLIGEAGAALSLGEVDPDIEDGFTLQGRNYYKNCSFAALMDEVRSLTESEVTKRLFG